MSPEWLSPPKLYVMIKEDNYNPYENDDEVQAMSDWVAVVDDDIMNLRLASRILSAEKMRVSCLKSGEALLEFLRENHPDLILLDIHMPQMDGFETIAAIRRREETASIPVIFLTGDEDSGTESKGLLAGAMDFLTKPFVPEILLLRVRHTIELTRLKMNLEQAVEKKTAEVLAQRKQIKDLKKTAATDQMTGLLNKAYVQEEIGVMCRQSRGVLMMIDLDSFKLVNDLYGHNMGDEILIHFAQIIRSAIRSTDIAGRMGGDEFIAFCQNITDEAIIAEKSAYINEELIRFAKELLGENMTIPLGASVGAVVAPDEGTDFLTLYQKADEALYDVKQNGKHGYAFYWATRRPDTDESAADRDQAMAILHERGRKKGALDLSLEKFRLLFQFLVRMKANYPINNRFVLFSLKAANGEENPERLEETIKHFREVVVSTLRASDAVTQSGTNQCMVLILWADREDGETVVERIIRKWDGSGYGIGFELSYETDWIR